MSVKSNKSQKGVQKYLGTSVQTIVEWGWALRESYRRDKKPLSVESCWSDFPPRELLLGFGVVEYFGGYLMNRRSSSFLIHRSSLVIAVIAQAFVTRGLKQVYSSNLLVTYSREENAQFKRYYSKLKQSGTQSFDILGKYSPLLFFVFSWVRWEVWRSLKSSHLIWGCRHTWAQCAPCMPQCFIVMQDKII